MPFSQNKYDYNIYKFWHQKNMKPRCLMFNFHFSFMCLLLSKKYSNVISFPDFFLLNAIIIELEIPPYSSSLFSLAKYVTEFCLRHTQTSLF